MHMKSLAQRLSYSKFSINVGCFHEELSPERNTNPEILESFLPQIDTGPLAQGYKAPGQSSLSLQSGILATFCNHGLPLALLSCILLVWAYLRVFET